MPQPKDNNVVKLDPSSKDVGEVWLINTFNIDLSSSAMVSATIRFYDYREDSNFSFIVFEVCRVEKSDFTDEIEEYELAGTLEKVLTNVRGLYQVTESDFLEETIVKYNRQYPQNEEHEFYHFIVSSDTEVLHIAGTKLPQLVFENEILEFNLAEPKE